MALILLSDHSFEDPACNLLYTSLADPFRNLQEESYAAGEISCSTRGFVCAFKDTARIFPHTRLAEL